MRRALVACAVAALAWPGSSWAHARLVRTDPPDGAVLATAPQSVSVVFDDDVRVAGGNAVVSNADSSSVLAGSAHLEGGRTLVLPLSRLSDGDYTVRWSIVSDDGHREQGVLAFAVGAGRASPGAVLAAQTGLRWQDVLLRTLFLLGVLVSAGALLQLRDESSGRGLLFLAFTSALLGGSTLLHSTGGGGTRFALALEVGTTAALVGAAVAALLPWYRWLGPVVWIAVGVLLPVPTLSGHALDPGRPRLLSAGLDLAHTGAAAAWLGGLVALAFSTPPERAVEGARRLSRVALVSVVTLAATGVGRALIELDGPSQLWTTGYGRAILVKTALLFGLLALGWANRVRLLPALDRVTGAVVALRRNVLGETALLGGVVVAVAVLTMLRPAGQGVAAAQSASGKPPEPPVGALQLARQDRDLAVTLAATSDRLTVTLIAPAGEAFGKGASLRVDNAPAPASSCGPGCLTTPVPAPPRTVVVAPTDYPAVEFALPPKAPPADAFLRRVERAFRRLRTVRVAESLASSPTASQRSRLQMAAPNRFAFQLEDGTAGVVIGGRRWDRIARGPWRQGLQQPPLRLPSPLWTAARRDARLIGPYRLAFFDPTVPAWFDVQVERGSSLPQRVRMIAAAHFMVDRYSGFDRPVRIVPPQ